MLGLFLLFLLAFIFFSLITHFYFSLLENDLRWIAASKTLVASENIVRLATFELRAIPLYHSPVVSENTNDALMRPADGSS